MRLTLILFLFVIGIVFSLTKVSAQTIFSGTWKGASFTDSLNVQSTVEMEIKIIGGLIEGVLKTQNAENTISVMKIVGQKKYLNFNIRETERFVKKKREIKPELKKYSFKYNIKTGYLEAFRDSLTDFKTVLFKERFEFKPKSKALGSTHWIDAFVKDYNNGISAPEKRLEELRDFVFKPIHFDVDQSKIKEEYISELHEIIRIIKSHSDLRVKVVGHTDSDGSDSYNQNLSKRRAQSIIDFFTKNGLRRDRIVIDFKGEKHPTKSNKTTDGKKLNRRVDFSFI